MKKIYLVMLVICAGIGCNGLTPQGKAVRDNLLMNYANTAISQKAQNDVNAYTREREKRGQNERTKARGTITPNGNRIGIFMWDDDGNNIVEKNEIIAEVRFSINIKNMGFIIMSGCEIERRAETTYILMNAENKIVGRSTGIQRGLIFSKNDYRLSNGLYSVYVRQGKINEARKFMVTGSLY